MLVYRLWRIWCGLFGCRFFDEPPYVPPFCRRCGQDLYDGFYDGGRLTPVIDKIRHLWFRTVWFISGRKCDVCRKIMRGPYAHTEYCCSEKCYSDWCPF